MTTASPATEREFEIREIQALLDGAMPFRGFRPELEEGFLAHSCDRSLRLIRESLWVALFSYAALGLLTRWQIARLSTPAFLAGNLEVWRWTFLVEALVVLVLVLIPYLPACKTQFRAYASATSCAGIAFITIATSAFPEPYFNIYSSYLVILVTVIVYGLGGMRMWQTAVACAGALVISLAVILWQHYWLNPGYFLAYMVLANGVGMLLCYLLEIRDRVSFLQSRLLALEKVRLDEYAAEVARLSREDTLTGLANRREFNETLHREWDLARRQKQPLALIFLDVDQFKPFNDTHGHVEGDRALAAVGNTLARLLKRPADMAARYGGEEFVLLLPNTPLAGACEIAMKVKDAIEELNIPHHASTVADHMTASLGVAAMVPGTENSSTQLVAWADEAAYAAKAAGRNQVVMAG
jgi:diguanylate cyclase (GGDEF)-like protein